MAFEGVGVLPVEEWVVVGLCDCSLVLSWLVDIVTGWDPMQVDLVLRSCCYAVFRVGCVQEDSEEVQSSCCLLALRIRSWHLIGSVGQVVSKNGASCKQGTWGLLGNPAVFTDFKLLQQRNRNNFWKT